MLRQREVKEKSPRSQGRERGSMHRATHLSIPAVSFALSLAAFLLPPRGAGGGAPAWRLLPLPWAPLTTTGTAPLAGASNSLMRPASWRLRERGGAGA